MAKVGWCGEYWGIFSKFATGEMGTNYWVRYRRRGLLDCLPPDVDEYERDLAICADDIAVEVDTEAGIKSYKASQDLRELTEEVLSRLQDSLNLVLARRMTMTRREAESQDFQGAVLSLIMNHLETLRDCADQGNILDPYLLAMVELKLKKLLGPWFSIAIYCGVSFTPRLPLVILSPHTARVTAPIATTAANMETIPNLLRFAVLLSVRDTIERVRISILSGKSLSIKEHEFAECFREYLETGNESRMPVLAYGSREAREVTFKEYQKRSKLKCPPGCQCMVESDRIALFRQSMDPEAVRERTIIQHYFSSNTSPSSNTSLGLSRQPRRSATREDKVPVSAADVDTLVGMGFKKDLSKFSLEMTESCK
jgi:hypothetical protein